MFGCDTMTVEKRKNPRFQCSRLQEFPVDFGDHQGTGCLFVLSREGLAIQSSRQLTKDETYRFEIWVSALEKPVSCEAHIMWVRSQPGSKNYHCGARILKIDPSSKIDLLDILYQDWKQKTVNRS